MAVGMARRLVWSGLATPEEVEAALRDHVKSKVPFLRALLSRRPGLQEALDRELRRGARATTTSPIAPAQDLLSRLPAGLCEQLLALPIARDEEGRIAVAAADPHDPHVSQELSYHLGAPVRVIQAPLEELFRALRSRRRPVSPPTPAFGTPAYGSNSSVPPAPRLEQRSSAKPSERPSERPIPLVRLHAEIGDPASTKQGPATPDAALVGLSKAGPSTMKGLPVASRRLETAETVPSTVHGVAPPGGPASPDPVVVGRRAPSEPVIELTRSKGSAKSSRKRPAAEADHRDVFQRLEEAKSADEVVECLLGSMRGLAGAVVVFAHRGGVFQGRAASDTVPGKGWVKAVEVKDDRPSVLQTAAQAGQYLGPLPETEVHAGLKQLLGDPLGEVAVQPVLVSAKTALVLVASDLDNGYLVTRRADQVSRAASRALERIVRQRKGS